MEKKMENEMETADEMMRPVAGLTLLNATVRYSRFRAQGPIEIIPSTRPA